MALKITTKNSSGGIKMEGKNEWYVYKYVFQYF